jgi:hypothetical protein
MYCGILISVNTLEGEKLLAQSAILKDNMGLEAEAQAEITKESIRTGKEIEQITKNSYGNIAVVGAGKKIQFDLNKLLLLLFFFLQLIHF